MDREQSIVMHMVMNDLDYVDAMIEVDAMQDFDEEDSDSIFTLFEDSSDDDQDD